ncbi:MAG: delta-60 repeat domain-containing protein, partial [Candidatus Pacebacteria bacterium]|nr:delta-60 repeat domain-containing protein [Candidatus Paceibacterota bacterium]
MIFLKKSITIFLFVVLALGNFSQVLAFSDGTEDTDFYTNLGTGFNNEVLVIAEQSDGDILVGGDFTSLNGNIRNHFGRLNSDGTEDTAFYTNLGTGFDNSVFGLAVDANGKILVGGGFAYLNDNLRNYFVRLNSDGTEDADFITNLGDGFDSEVDIITVQNDGKILVGGAFSNLNNNPRPVMVRLNSDGTEDVDFDNNLGDGFNDTPIAIQEQDDGKILIGGYFSTLDNNPRTLLVRLNADGTEDTDFYTNLGTGFVGSFVSSVLLQDDGKILVGGNFTNFNGNVRNRLIRLNSDGTEDTAFYANSGPGFGNNTKVLRLQ